MNHKPTPFETVCEHPPEDQHIRVAFVAANCETTVIACRQCGTDLTEPETNC